MPSVACGDLQTSCATMEVSASRGYMTFATLLPSTGSSIGIEAVPTYNDCCLTLPLTSATSMSSARSGTSRWSRNYCKRPENVLNAMPWGNIMGNTTLLGYWIRRFLLEHLIGERNLARNTQLGYRDALALLVPFASRKLNMSADTLNVTDLSADLLRTSLPNLVTSRKCSIQTRNQRLAAIHAFARFVGEHSLEHIAWCAQIRLLPFKRATRAAVGYLDKSEMDALLATPDRQTDQGRRDYALMLFLYNSGARADQAAQLLIKDDDL